MSHGPNKQASSSRLWSIAAACAVALAGCSLEAPPAESAADAPAPLLEAVLVGDAAAVRTLIAAGADVHATEIDGTTLLMRAAHGGNPEIASLLIAAGADVHAANRYGVHALYLAARGGDAATARELLASGADPNAALPEGETVLMTAAKNGSVEVVRALLGSSSADALPASSGYAAAALLPSAGPVRRADPNGRESWHGQTALMWAAAEDHVDIVRLLLEAGADPNAETARLDAPAAEGAAVAQGRLTALHFAARAGRVEAARALLDGGARVDAATQFGDTALHLAAGAEAVALIELLADRGAALTAQNARGQTPLDIALAARAPGMAPSEAAATLLARLERAGS